MLVGEICQVKIILQGFANTAKTEIIFTKIKISHFHRICSELFFTKLAVLFLASCFKHKQFSLKTRKQIS